MAEQNSASKTVRENSILEPTEPSVQYRPLPDNHKSVFFGILKCLLQEPHTLQDGMWHEEKKNGKVFKLIYGRKGCKVFWEFRGDKSETVVAALDIYLQWRGDYTEELSLKNLQTVQNELKALGLQDERVHACFSLAKHIFIQEPPNVQCNSTLSISDETTLTFGRGFQKKMTVMYDEKKCAAVYYVQ